MIDNKLLDILACPACKGDVKHDSEKNVIKCSNCDREYPIKDGIPVMLIEESTQPNN